MRADVVLAYCVVCRIVLRTMFEKAVREETVLRSMPCGKLHSQPLHRPGAMIIGDAFNVRHPLTGAWRGVAC